MTLLGSCKMVFSPRGKLSFPVPGFFPHHDKSPSISCFHHDTISMSHSQGLLPEGATRYSSLQDYGLNQPLLFSLSDPALGTSESNMPANFLGLRNRLTSWIPSSYHATSRTEYFIVDGLFYFHLFINYSE